MVDRAVDRFGGRSLINRRHFLRGSGLLVGGLAAATSVATTNARPAWRSFAALGARQSADTPTPGGTMTWAQELDPVSLDPHTTSNFSAVQAIEHVYQSLTMYDESLNVVPSLAESWEMPNDTTYIMHLRQGVKWHDDSDFTADDVKYSLERLLAPETAGPYATWFNAIKTIDIVDPHTVQFNLDAPFAPLLANFAAMRGSSIIKKDAAENSNLQLEAIGTGPFKMTEYVPESHFTLTKNENYWEEGLPYVDEVTFKILVEEDARVAALRSDQIQYAYLTVEGAERLAGEGNVSVMRSPKAWLVAHFMNTFREPFTDVRVRQAVSLAVNRQEVIDKAVGGAGVLSGPMPTGHQDWFIPVESLPYQQDLERAKALLAEAGLEDGFKTTITCSPQYPEFVAASVVLQQQLAQIGIEAEVVQMEWGQFVSDTSRAKGWNYDIKITAFTFYPDP
ncbi:MAG: ABC transporter substrate-binding protein, partial [Chloroflexota bacterium]|nr:ABC transporter substrate-binding protein [Chloroflexota bacterium]